MREIFKIQLSVDILPIKDVIIPTNRRDKLPSILKALQHLYCSETLRPQVEKILSSVNTTRIGRTGMNLWESLVLAVLRNSLNISYEQLHDNANNHRLIRQIMGVENTWDYYKQKEYGLTTIKDCVRLITDQMISEINELVVSEGHYLIKKR